MACLFACALLPQSSGAQSIGEIAPEVPAGSQMLLEADTLVYDNDNQTVTAVGGVQINYGGNRLVAQRVEYDRNTKRLTATGDVQLIDRDGTKVYSDHLDVTDDFADGFANALRVETVDKTYFAAESGERMGGVLTTFHNGVYTACKPCEDKPDKPPIWRLKARKIIWNGQKHVVRFEDSNFEFFGFPLASLPVFEIADPTVKRKSGFLMPSFDYKTGLGFGFGIPYYFALSPTYDLTVKGTGFTKQGFLGEAEWRQRFNNGQYSLKIAGISQNNPEELKDDARFTVDSGPNGDPNKRRGMIGSKGEFEINPRWTFGWDVLLQSDKNFSRTYGIEGYNDSIHRSEVYLTGLHDRNYFDLRAMHFDVQEDRLDDSTATRDTAARDEKQPWVLPSLDYAYIPDTPVAGGQLSVNVNARVIERDDLDVAYNRPRVIASGVQRVRGIEGDSERLTAEAEWKRSITTDGGLVITPLLALRGDASYAHASSDSLDAVNSMAANGVIEDAYPGVEADVRSSLARYMATAGMELRWPVLFSSVSSTHILEPMAQVFVRPDEQYAEDLGLINEDAQSFVFDATTLFERDKFSGYDRMEGGTRANIGLRYSGSYDSGWATHALFGQSYQLAGQNPFASPDLVNVGAYSGLESNRSDYVGLVGFSSPGGLSASLGGRFDEQTFDLRRADVRAAYVGLPVSLTAQYAFIERQPLYGFDVDRHEVTLGASVSFAQYWKVFGAGTYDLVNNVLVKDGLGFGYADECFTYLMTFSETRSQDDPSDVSQSVGFKISFRTLGDFGSATSSFTE